MNNIIFNGIMTALITPFDQDGKIKSKTVSKLVEYQLAAGIEGFYLSGGTGEGVVSSLECRVKMLESVIEANRKRGKIIVQVGSINTSETLEFTRQAQKLGVDGISSVPPAFYYNYNSEEIVDYYQAIADNTDLPVLIYRTPAIDVKGVVGLIEKLMKIDNIIGLKYTGLNYYEMWKLLQINDGNINIINGSDETLLCALVTGAAGGIGATYNVAPELFVGLYKAFRQGNMNEAQKLQNRINQLIQILAKYIRSSIVSPLKCFLELNGLDVGGPAFPAKTLSIEEKAAFKQDLEKNGFLESNLKGEITRSKQTTNERRCENEITKHKPEVVGV